MTIKLFRFFICLAIVGFWTARGSAVVLFSDNFNDVNTSGLWTKNSAPTANAGVQDATFAYDYSVMGIPASPGAADTLGLRLRANLPIVGGVEVTTRPAGVTSGLSLSPTGKNFGTNYKMSFYAWSNFFGAPNTLGLADNGLSEGGTANVMFAVGTSGTVPLVVANTALVTNGVMDGVGFATTGDGGIANDYRVYPASGTIVPGTTAGVYAAGATATANQNTNAFYTALFPTKTAPVVQQGLSTAEYGGDASNTQLGSMQAGSFGFAWHKVVITKNNNIVTWNIDDTLIATEDASALTLGGANIALGVSDVNSTTARHPSLVFTVFDNLVVTDLAAAVTPGDFDHDGDVDGDDLTQWQGDFGANGDSDADGDLDSDGADYIVWQQNYTGPAGSAISTTTIPEPASQIIATLAVFAFYRWRRVAG